MVLNKVGGASGGMAGTVVQHMRSIIILFTSVCFISCSNPQEKNIEPTIENKPLFIEGKYQMINHHGPVEVFLKPNYYLQSFTNSVYGLESMIIGHYEYNEDTLILVSDFYGRSLNPEEQDSDFYNDFDIHELENKSVFTEKASFKIRDKDTLLVFYKLGGHNPELVKE